MSFDPLRITHLRADLGSAALAAASRARLFPGDVSEALLRGITKPAEHALQSAERNRAVDSRELAFARLFVVGLCVPREEAADLFSTLTLDGAFALGLLSEGSVPGTVCAALSLTPHEGWWIISDLDDHLRQGPAHPEHVMGVGAATLSLLSAIPQARVDSALDVGTGCGVVALSLAQHAAQVTATDLSPRALLFARMNAALNKVTNIDFLEGDLYAPVQQETFDLIVSNPPFVISPHADDHYVYRTSGEPGDRLLRRLLAATPSMLAAQGTFVGLANWEFRWGGNDREATLRDLVPDVASHAAAWMIERGRQTPLEYAALWLRDGGLEPSDPEYAAQLMAWIEDLTARGVSRVCFGYLMIRRTSGPGEVRYERVDGALGVGTHLGDEWSRTFSELLRVQSLSDEALISSKFVLAPDVEEIRTMIPGTESITAISLVKRSGIERYHSVDTFTGAFLGACDGELTAAEIATALAELLEIDLSAAHEAAVDVVREYAAQGFIRREEID